MDAENFSPTESSDAYSDWSMLEEPDQAEPEPSPLDDLAAAGELCSPDQ